MRRVGVLCYMKIEATTFFLTTSFEQNMEGVVASVPATVELEFSTARQVIHPMEGKGLVAYWDHRAKCRAKKLHRHEK